MRKRLLLAASLFLVITTTSCDAGSVEPIKLDEWFYSRLMWTSLASAIAGVLVALFHLCRLRFPPGEFNARWQARKKFGMWLILVFLGGSVWLFIDAWMVFPFDEFLSLGFSQVFWEVFLNYRTLLLLILAILVFSIFVAIATRFFKADCRCKYAFINK